MNRFEDRVILITGAASGIGRASAIRLAQEGGRIVCVDIQQEAQLPGRVAAICRNVGGVGHAAN